MAKARKLTNLSQDDQFMYSQLTPENKQAVDAQPNQVEKAKLIKILFNAQPSGQPATQPSAAAGALGLQPYQGSPTATTTGRFEPALGLETGRMVDPVTGQVIAGTTQKVVGTARKVGATLEERLVPPSFTPRYFDRDADLIATFGRDQIADIQGKMKTAGLLGSKYRVGVVDEVTKNAWVRLLGEANRSNADWQTALAVGVTTPITGPAKLPPKVSNPADITKIVQQVAGKVLGRSADQKTVDAIVRQFQASQVASQTGALPMADGRRVEPMDLQTLAERKLQKAAGPEAEAYRFAQFAARVFGEAGSGAGVEMPEVGP